MAVLGLAYFVAMTLLVLPPAWRHRILDPVRLAAATAGMAMVVYLVWAELFRIDAICLGAPWRLYTLGLFATVLCRTASGKAIPQDINDDEAGPIHPHRR